VVTFFPGMMAGARDERRSPIAASAEAEGRQDQRGRVGIVVVEVAE
jgi:hypothetical protein